LKIPFGEISCRSAKTYLFYEVTELSFGKCPGVRIKIENKLAEMLRKASNGAVVCE
jgi:hypothetical protein